MKPDYYDVVVLGGGAAGLMCAFTAGQRGRRVLLLEKANRLGKKILMSGGGRCNFTNLSVEADNFICSNPHFCKSALKRYTQWDFISLVESHGIEYEERKHSQLFCLHSAREILNMLLSECDSAGVAIETRCEVVSVDALENSRAANDTDMPSTPESARYRVELTQTDSPRTVLCNSLVVATGALSIPTLGGGGQGYDIARQFGMTLVPSQAGLVPFMFSDSMLALCERLAGVSLEVEACCGQHRFTEHMLFTHRGVSGPAILQISNYWSAGNTLTINLLPGVDAGDWLINARAEHGKARLSSLLNRSLPKALVAELQALWWPAAPTRPLGEFGNQQLREIGAQLNRWALKPSSTEGYRTAEVTLGGVSTEKISSKTLEALHHPGLFFVGEVLDVTGHLGGFNFQWAWSSGYTAGLFA